MGDVLLPGGRRWGVLVIVTVAVLVISVLGGPLFGAGQTFTRWVRYSARPDLSLTLSREPLPASPLGARRASAAVWSGSELLVWGGIRPRDRRGAETTDGAAYDPKARTWRTLARSPLAERGSHVAVWSGTELLVWGGRRPDGSAVPRGGAAYDPATDRWRPIANAPERTRAGAAGLWWQGRMVVLGGLSYEPVQEDDGLSYAVQPSPYQARSSVLFYDPAADRWQRVVVTGEARTAAVVGERLVIAGVYRDGRVWASAISPGGLDEEWADVSPALPRRPGDLSLVADPQRLTLVAEYPYGRYPDGDRTLLASVRVEQLGNPAVVTSPPWSVVDVGADVQGPTAGGESIGRGIAVAVSPRRLLLATDVSVHVVDPVTGADVELGDTGVLDLGAATAWAGTRLFSVGGSGPPAAFTPAPAAWTPPGG